ncbi:MAG: hypothetical protein JXB62_12170 [Pirellulales bacterium]|nr:hypothetical protein [Pirellulales bacterium]
MTAIGKHWPLAAALAVLYAALAVCLAVSLERNDGHFVYVLDDPYIHMAVARNLSEHGVFGITRYEFSSSTSSIDWPLLLALSYWLTGPGVFAPLVLNVAAATAVVWLAYVLLRQRGIPPGLNLVSLLILCFCTPLPAIVFTGMEHTLHVLLAVGFVFLAARFLAEEPEAARASSGGLRAIYFALPPLITMTRYEGAFLVAVVGLLSVLRRRFRQAAALGVLGAAPVVLSGLVSMAHGWHFLPNSVLLKGRMPPGSSLDQVLGSLRSTAVTLIQQPHIPALGIATLLLLLVLLRRDPQRWTQPKLLIWIVVLTAALHVQFARTDWFFRYEAYLVASALLVILVVAYDELLRGFKPGAAAKPIVACALAALLALPLASRAARSLVLIPRVSSVIYEQHYQMASFVKRYYSSEAVAANDVGTINFYADIRNLDLWGLGDLEVADARLRQRYGPKAMRRLAAARGVKIAMVYADWFDRWYGGLPPQWQCVGQWEIAAADDRRQIVVSFYAVDSDAKDALAANLREFSPHLPVQVNQRGPYLQAVGPPVRMAGRP